MNKDKLIIILIGIVFLGVIANIYIFRSSDEEAILSTLESIANLMTTEEQLKPLQAALRLESLQKLTSQKLEASLKTEKYDHSISSFQPIKSGALAASKMITKSDVSLIGVKIEVQGDIAFANFNVVLTGIDNKGEKFRQRYFSRTRLGKAEDETWIVQQMNIEE